MKLKTLAAVVAGALVLPMMAQAEVASTMSIDGDIGVAYNSETETIGEIGSELNFDGAAEVDGVTYMGHFELDVNGTNSTPNIDEVRVGAKGGFGEVWLGEVDNACDQFDPGAEDIWIGAQSASCGGSDISSILYKNKMGNTEYAVSHNPNADQTAIGARFGMGPVKVNLAYEDLDGTDLISYGVAGSFGPIAVNAEGNDDDDWGLNASYAANNQVFWISYGDDGVDDGVGGGYRYSHGKMDYIIEYDDPSDTTVAGMRYRF
uniref:Porin domain-containing protein n=1 Tax=uncultured Thiotrichaceae bacterium TaxID=298394 RepID=A0A6S6SRU6_9GAMM|nr:MAG: Unknown protein [uncultured Thiotrichaceae bacterium]